MMRIPPSLEHAFAPLRRRLHHEAGRPRRLPRGPQIRAGGDRQGRPEGLGGVGQTQCSRHRRDRRHGGQDQARNQDRHRRCAEPDRRLSDRQSRRHHRGRRPLPGPPAYHRLPRRRHRRHARRLGTARGLAAMKQATARAAANWRRVYAMPVASVYPSYIAKAAKKGRDRAEVDEILRWLTGHSQASLEEEFAKKTSFEDFFAHAPKMNPSRFLITGVVCGVRVEKIQEPMMREIRYLDKLIDELAKGKAMEKILRK